jgi:dTDP-4-amino-4,6-dideoxygalactose transaminase
VQKIPLCNLKLMHDEIADELRDAIAEVIESNWFVGGPVYKRFAASFAEYCGVDYCIPCGNGTDALYLALRAALGIGDGEKEVITVSHTFVATTEAIVQAGFQPVLIDINPETYVMDIDQIEDAITPNTVAIVPVHLYGQMVPMPPIAEIAARHDLVVIEDAAQCHGARYAGTRPGQLSDAATFSFYPGKNLGAWGDAGAVVLRDETMANQIFTLSDHGRRSKHEHGDIGVNSRTDAIQAAVLDVKLRHIDRWNQTRRDIADAYRELLADDECILPAVDPLAEHVYHQFVVQVDDRDDLLKHLNEAGIGAGIHYPIPVHEQPAYDFLGIAPTDLPVTHALCKRIMSLPIFPGMTREQIERVCHLVRSAIPI